ncbi:MAG: pyridoxal-dependent decarboxylase [Gammaproteobacteria bacterium]|nr:pyridoxal-dependent decarboxylase [Gammaproteobacteria bacterium]
MTRDAAETSNIGESLAAIGAALDEFARFGHGDAQPARERWQRMLEQPLPRHGAGLDTVLAELCEQLIPNGSAVARPGFSAYITTGPTTVAIAAATAAMLAAPQRQMLHAFNFIEELSLDWLRELLGLPVCMKGIYSSGGSVANLVALGGARQWALEQAGIDPAAEGMSRRAVLYASSETHHTVKRAAGVLGIGRNNVINIETDRQGRIVPRALRERIAQDRARDVLAVAVVASAGTTNTGAIDPLYEIGSIAAEHGLWFHVDGAYGLFGILDQRKAPLYRGIELADSAIVDPHKWMGAPVGVAASFVRDRELLLRAFTQEPAAYLEGSVHNEDAVHSMDSLGIPYADFGIELSAAPRGVVVWAMLREIGATGMRERVVRHNDMASHVAERARADPRLELLLEPTLSVCCFRFRAPGIGDLDAFNRRIHRRLLQGNEHLPSTTMVNGCLAIRPCFIGARTTARYADELVDAVLDIGQRLLAADGSGTAIALPV